MSPCARSRRSFRLTAAERRRRTGATQPRRSTALCPRPRDVSPYPAAVPVVVCLDLGRQFLHAPAIVPRWPVRLAIAHWRFAILRAADAGRRFPSACRATADPRTSLFGPVGKQALHGVDGGLPGAQHIAPATVRLIAKFGGVAIRSGT